MNDFITKRVIISAVVFLAVIATGTFLFLRYFGKDPASPRGAGTIDYANLPAGNGTIIYTAEGFTPVEMTISADSGFGCIVNMINNTETPLKFGIKQSTPGPEWPLIKPGENLLFDPRFPGISELKLQNQATPGHAFTIRLDASCR